MESESQVRTRIIEIIQMNQNLSESQNISDSTPLMDILSNSVEFIQIIVDIEDEFDIEFHNDELVFQSYSTVGDLVKKTKNIVNNVGKRGNNGTGTI